MARIDSVVEAYRKIRDERARLKKDYEEADALFRGKLETLEAYMLGETAKQGVDSFKTPFGTAYKYHATGVTTSDWDAVLGFIRDNELWNMLEHRVSKKAVEEYKDEHEVYPPGLDVTTIAKMGFRAS